MNILIIRLSAIGDVVHALAMVAPLKKKYPGCRITWVIEEETANLLEHYPGIDRVIISRRRRWLRQVRGGQPVKALRQAAAFVKMLRSDRYDLVLDFQGLLKSGLIAFLSRSQRKIGYRNAREMSPLFYSEKAPATDFNDHALNRHQVILNHLGIKDPAVSFAPFYSRRDEDKIDQLFRSLDIDCRKNLVVVHPCAGWPTKVWPKQKVAGLCDRLIDEQSCAVVLAGSYAEAGFLNEIVNLANNRLVSLAGKTKLTELAGLMARADLAVSTDSGPMHLACAVGTPVVAIMGSTAPWRTGPFGDRYTVIRKELFCSPCYQKKKCPLSHHRCMAEISVEEVFKTCCNWLAG